MDIVNHYNIENRIFQLRGLQSQIATALKKWFAFSRMDSFANDVLAKLKQ